LWIFLAISGTLIAFVGMFIGTILTWKTKDALLKVR
jgi:hypothetical protein